MTKRGGIQPTFCFIFKQACREGRLVRAPRWWRLLQRVFTELRHSTRFQTPVSDCSWTAALKKSCSHPEGYLSWRDKNFMEINDDSEAISASYGGMKGSGRLPADFSLCRSHSAKHLRCKLNKVPPLLFTDALTICCEHLIAARRQKPQTPRGPRWSK